MPTESQLDATLRDRYAVLVDERNAARRELEAARAWMRECRIGLGFIDDMLRRAGAVEVAVHVRALAERCPLPPEEDHP